MRLDKHLQQKYLIPYSLAQKVIRKGFIKVDGKRQKDPAFKISENSEIFAPNSLVVNSTAQKSQEDLLQKKQNNLQNRLVKYQSIFKELENSIIFEDDALFVINKPSGLAVQGGSGLKYSLDDFLDHLQKIYPQKYPHRPHITHRIDKETKGITIFAKTLDATKKIGELFKNHEINKTYIAAAINNLSDNLLGVDSTFTIKNYITKHAFKAVCSDVNINDDYKQAITKCTIVGYCSLADAADFDVSTKSTNNSSKECVILKLQPQTGRFHQIRAQLAAMQSPIVGDFKYEFNGDRNLINDLKLFATRVEFLLNGKNYDIKIT